MPRHVVRPEGELDAHTLEAFRSALGEAPVGDIVVDLTDVTFIDSTALGAIVQASKRASARGDTLTVVASDPHIRKVIEVTGLSQAFRLVRSADDAAG